VPATRTPPPARGATPMTTPRPATILAQQKAKRPSPPPQEHAPHQRQSFVEGHDGQIHANEGPAAVKQVCWLGSANKRETAATVCEASTEICNGRGGFDYASGRFGMWGRVPEV